MFFSYVCTFLCFCLYRLEEALSDCIWAQKHMRGNTVIDYKQLGLRFKLSSWQVNITRNVTFHSAVLYCTGPVKRVCQCQGLKKRNKNMQSKCHTHLQANKASLILCEEELHTNQSSADSSNCIALCTRCTCARTASFLKVKNQK